jgi:hypothetical protein
MLGSFALFLIGGIVVPIFPGLTQREIIKLSMEMALDAHCYSPQFCDQLGEEHRGGPFAIDLLQGRMQLQMERLRSASVIFNVRVHAYVLMSNHFPLIVETPKANCRNS